MTTTVIKDAASAIAWDAAAGRHVYRRAVDIAFADGTISFVRRNYAGTAAAIGSCNWIVAIKPLYFGTVSG